MYVYYMYFLKYKLPRFGIDVHIFQAVCVCVFLFTIIYDIVVVEHISSI